ncbi:hypothetical protein [Microbacterium arborescens]|uniref:hypothetical protein n=1 Tax=Microbacterium arborescens TaxID=33883 RepID=UPI00278AFBF0|nr:hypothetical protein [Microbacterium arborescens]MDQ1217978.1 DNA-binding XRE family transcriptional regulator [Microbacterium arborescens]
MSDDHAETPPTVAAAVGAFVRDYRARYHIARDLLAQSGSALGMTWGITSIENIEAGKFAPTLPTLFALCSALSAASWRTDERDRLTLPDLFEHVDRVTIGADYSVTKDRLLSFLGVDVPLAVGDWSDEYFRMLESATKRRNPTLAEKRAAKKLGIEPEQLRDAAYDLWSESLEEVVTGSVMPNATPQARGHETRARIEELRQYLKSRGGRG